MKRGWAALALLATLTACGGGADDDVVEQGAPGDAAAGETKDAPADEPQGQLLDSGFGQSGEYATAVAVVENTSDHGGQTVTLSVNFKNKANETIATETQVTSFNIAGQTIAVTVQATVGREKVASIEPTLLVEDEGTFDESEVDFGVVEADVVKGEYGGWTAKFTLANPTSEPLQSPSVQIACKDSAGTINGGGFTYPDLVPPNGDVLVDVDVTVTGQPAECTAYIGGPIF